MADFIEMDHAELMRQIADLDRQLSDMSESVCNEIIDTVAREAAGELQNEQKRLLAVSPSQGIRNLSADLAIWKDDSRKAPRKAAYMAGYPGNKIGTGAGKSIGNTAQIDAQRLLADYSVILHRNL